MNDEQRQQLDRLLRAREGELQEAIRQTREQMATPDAGTGADVRDSAEDGDARMMATLQLTQLRRDEQELREVAAARDRMRQGTYGLCEECEQPIPFGRLQARPEARLCIVHEEAWEKAHS